MGNRIRYENQDRKENVMISKNAYTSKVSGARYKIILDLNEMIYKIRNERTKVFTVVGDFKYGNLNALKKAARARLEKLGVQLSKESRWRTFGLCEEGYNQKKHTEGGDD